VSENRAFTILFGLTKNTSEGWRKLHNMKHHNFCELGFDVLKEVFWDTTPSPTCFTLVSSSAYSKTVKLEAICASETSADFQLTTLRYPPEDITLQN
jgi:hypothetical protein